jgi:hypothetical protein
MSEVETRVMGLGVGTFTLLLCAVVFVMTSVATRTTRFSAQIPVILFLVWVLVLIFFAISPKVCFFSWGRVCVLLGEVLQGSRAVFCQQKPQC